MCGGKYHDFKKHKALSKVRGEVLIERTIRLLEDNGAEWYISTNDPAFDKYGHVLHHENSFEAKDNVPTGYWVDAFYPTNEPTIYLHGDVWFSENAIKTILNHKTKVNTLVGNGLPKNPDHIDMGEPFAWIIPKPKAFRNAIKLTKQLQDRGDLARGIAISWELYRVMNGLNPNRMEVLDESYVAIDDDTIDVDTPSQIEKLNEGYGSVEKPKAEKKTSKRAKKAKK